jgi:hypothetical protein
MSSSSTPITNATINSITSNTSPAKTLEDYKWKPVVQDAHQKTFELQFLGKDSKLFTLKMNYPNSVNDELAVATMLAIADLVKRDATGSVTSEIMTYLALRKPITTFNILSPAIPDHEKIPQEQYGICLVFQGGSTVNPFMYVTDEYGEIKTKTFNNPDVNSATFKSELTEDWIYRGKTTSWKSSISLLAARVKKSVKFTISKEQEKLLKSVGYMEGFIITPGMPRSLPNEGMITINGHRSTIRDYINDITARIKTAQTQVNLKRVGSSQQQSLKVTPFENDQITGNGSVQ